MKVAIDLDGTLGKYPRQLKALADSLMRTGNTVLILTAAAGELPPELRPAEVARRLADLGAGHISFQCLESAEKPAYCQNNGIDILIDDTPFNLGPQTIQLIPQ